MRLPLSCFTSNQTLIRNQPSVYYEQRQFLAVFFQPFKKHTTP